MKIEISLNIKPVKKKHKIQMDCHMLEFIIPGAGKLDVLPRKKKKALKKKIAVDLLRYIDENAEELIANIEEAKSKNVNNFL